MYKRQYNDLSAWKNRNKPLERINPAKILNNSLKISPGKLPLTKGKIHLIREVDNEGKISVLNEAFKVSEEFIGEYVWATICLAERKLEVYYRAKDQDTLTKRCNEPCHPSIIILALHLSLSPSSPPSHPLTHWDLFLRPHPHPAHSLLIFRHPQHILHIILHILYMRNQKYLPELL